MLTRALLAVLALLSLATSALAQAGGEDVVVYRENEADVVVFGTQLVCTTDGTLVAALEIRTGHGTPDIDMRIELHRSDDGGATWSLWDVFGDADLASWQQDPCLRVIDTPAGERVLLAYVDWDGAGNELVATWADPAADPPVWTASTIIPSGAYGEPVVAQDPENPDVLYAIANWLYLNLKLVFTRSLDGGLTWSAPETIHDTSWSLHQVADLAAGPSGRVHVAVSEATGATAVRDVWVRSASNQAASLADWDAPARVSQGLFDVSYYDNYLAICASPTGPEVAVARSGHLIGGPTDDTFVTVSSNAGVSWSGPLATTAVLEEAVLPSLTWTGTDFAMIVSPDNTNDSFHDLARPEPGHATWTRTTMVDRPSTRGLAVVAADPSRGGQLALLGRSYRDGTTIVFDAEWRVGPGRGVTQKPWWYDLEATPVAALGTGDLNCDGNDDVLVALDDGRVEGILLDSILPGIYFAVDLAPTRAAGPPAAADLDGNQYPELYVGGDDGHVHAYDRFENPLPGFPVAVSPGDPCFVSLGAVGLDPALRVIAAAGSRIVVLDENGAPLPGFPVDLTAGIGPAVGPAAVGDADGDGDHDLVVAFERRAGVIGANGSELFTIHTGTPYLSAGASMADLDGDGDLEVALPHVNGELSVHEHDGTLAPGVWPLGLLGGPAGPVAIAVAHPDPFPSLAMAADNGVMWVDRLGIARLRQPSGAGVRVADPVLLDVGDAGDGSLLVDLRDDATGTLWLTARAQATWPRSLEGAVTVGAAAGDVDGDGLLELVSVQGDSLLVLDMGVPVSIHDDRRWPMVGHDLRRSGCADCPEPDGTTAVEPTLTRAALRMLGAAPNPFNPRTVIRFATGQDGPVAVSVVDLRGRRVRTLHGSSLPAGRHAVTWDGRNDGGRNMAAGRYTVLVEAAGQRTTVGVVMVK